jgi:hypothetical protein
MMDKHAEFIHILSILSSEDNQQRALAEERYKSLQNEGGDGLALLLLNTLSTTNQTIPSYLRKLSIILLRRLLIEQDESVYHHMTPPG